MWNGRCFHHEQEFPRNLMDTFSRVGSTTPRLTYLLIRTQYCCRQIGRRQYCLSRSQSRCSEVDQSLKFGNKSGQVSNCHSNKDRTTSVNRKYRRLAATYRFLDYWLNQTRQTHSAVVAGYYCYCCSGRRKTLLSKERKKSQESPSQRRIMVV